MRKRIHLRESQLHALVEQALNEISTETKMSAANKALKKARESGRKDDRRFRQYKVFSKGAEDDLRKIDNVTDARFFPHFEGGKVPRYVNGNTDWFDDRGSVAMYEPTHYSALNASPLYNSGGRTRLKNFLNGNSYYERGRGWMTPDDEGYDMEKSEPWAQIRQRNESIARRVTESVIRMLRESADDTGWSCEELDTMGYSFYIIDNAWTDYSAEELTKILEQIIIWHIESTEKDDVDNHVEGWSDEGAYLFIKAQDENPNDGSEYKGYPLYIHACYGIGSGPVSDNGWKWWASEIINMTPEKNEVRVEFADGENDPRTALVSQSVANIDWNKIMKSVEVYEGDEEWDDDYDPDDDFDYWEEKRYARMGY